MELNGTDAREKESDVRRGRENWRRERTILWRERASGEARVFMRMAWRVGGVKLYGTGVWKMVAKAARLYSKYNGSAFLPKFDIVSGLS